MNTGYTDDPAAMAVADQKRGRPESIARFAAATSSGELGFRILHHCGVEAPGEDQ
jgi:hypothetical protein